MPPKSSAPPPGPILGTHFQRLLPRVTWRRYLRSRAHQRWHQRPDGLQPQIEAIRRHDCRPPGSWRPSSADRCVFGAPKSTEPQPVKCADPLQAQRPAPESTQGQASSKGHELYPPTRRRPHRHQQRPARPGPNPDGLDNETVRSWPQPVRSSQALEPGLLRCLVQLGRAAQCRGEADTTRRAVCLQEFLPRCRDAIGTRTQRCLGHPQASQGELLVVGDCRKGVVFWAHA